MLKLATFIDDMTIAFTLLAKPVLEVDWDDECPVEDCEVP
jgi:hypothetical protein